MNANREIKVDFIKRHMEQNITNYKLISSMGVFTKAQAIQIANMGLDDAIDAHDDLNKIYMETVIKKLVNLNCDKNDFIKCYDLTSDELTKDYKMHVLSDLNLDEIITELLIHGSNVSLDKDVALLYDTVVFVYNQANQVRTYSLNPEQCPVYFCRLDINQVTLDDIQHFDGNGYSGRYPLSDIRYIKTKLSLNDLLYEYHIVDNHQNIKTIGKQALLESEVINPW